MAMPLMQIANVTKRYGGLVALNNVSLDLTPGEIVGLIGPNGAGKTTLVNVITGVQHPDKGTITFEGKRIEREPAYQLYDRGGRPLPYHAWAGGNACGGCGDERSGGDAAAGDLPQDGASGQEGGGCACSRIDW